MSKRWTFTKSDRKLKKEDETCKILKDKFELDIVIEKKISLIRKNDKNI